MSFAEASWPDYAGPLGSQLLDHGTVFTVWSPSAAAVTLRLFDTSDPKDNPSATIALERAQDGAWQHRSAERLAGTYYDYMLTFPASAVSNVPSDAIINAAEGTVTIRTADPWAKASGVNGEHSMVVNLSSTNPDGWLSDRSPDIPASQTVIWETHVGDFSNDPHGGFPEGHRGKFLAFTDAHTTLDNQPGGFPTGIAYLKRLGVTHVQIMPFYDYGSVDEATGSPYNWGYDPVAYDVPEGSYSTDPYDGAVRIRECKAMIAALHRAGIRVIMDVVYNHMYENDNEFERMAPGYFCRRDDAGGFANGSGCGNDMASERPMFSRFIVDSLVYWAREYHVDGFRFDLMGLLDTQTLNRARKELDKLPGGESILMYGEPWSADKTNAEPSFTLADKQGRKLLDARIGWFCDESRDSIKGNVMLERKPGYVNGKPSEFAELVRHALNGWRGTEAQGKQVGQTIQYVSAHDDLTLWDKLCLTMRDDPAHADYDATGDVQDILAANAIAAGLVLTSAGLPFMLSGEEFTRTKYGCDNSFDRSAELNWLDWGRASRLSSLIEWYRTLIGVRKTHPAFYDGQRIALDCPEDVVAARVGDSLAVCANPTTDTVTIRLPEDVPSSGKHWGILADSTDVAALSADLGARIANGVELSVPARTFVVCEYADSGVLQ
ncbi:type I pullulanase [Bifidobacterium thermacidophilum]|uniref:Pullulanase n=1 Tax=Bifidobacterium thermacidophilum subsp. thermacidophilum TaxID=79262 RepID=A0A087EAL8_9BIFI|nr:type I pullulanase [Bifidobacterium thermacidophilum]KFJ04819.1 pullulanase precursor [Bifidobacterium thermacidophilum subsp. thermacidophilum]